MQGAGYKRRALIDLEEPTTQPAPKPKAPEEPNDEEIIRGYEIKIAEYEASCEVWKEEVKTCRYDAWNRRPTYSLLLTPSSGDSVHRI
jgi:hypothetical protein